MPYVINAPKCACREVPAEAHPYYHELAANQGSDAGCPYRCGRYPCLCGLEEASGYGGPPVANGQEVTNGFAYGVADDDGLVAPDVMEVLVNEQRREQRRTGRGLTVNRGDGIVRNRAGLVPSYHNGRLLEDLIPPEL